MVKNEEINHHPGSHSLTILVDNDRVMASSVGGRLLRGHLCEDNTAHARFVAQLREPTVLVLKDGSAGAVRPHVKESYFADSSTPIRRGRGAWPPHQWCRGRETAPGRPCASPPAYSAWRARPGQLRSGLQSELTWGTGTFALPTPFQKVLLWRLPQMVRIHETIATRMIDRHFGDCG